MAASRHECSICMDSFKNPKLISCHHSFCYKCLEGYVQVNLHNGRFNCPICRTSVKLPDKGISGFQSNFYIDTEKNENFPCEICGPKNVASSRCLDCEENLCQSCCYVHEKLKATRHHKIRDLVTLDSEMKGKIRQRVFCDQHPEEEIKLVCQDCKVTICFMCKAVKHDTHPTQSLADVAAEVKMTLDAKLNQCSDKLRRIKASTVKGGELDRSINDAEQKELKAVDDQCSQLHKAIDEEAAKFKDKIRSVYRLLREQNAVFKSNMQEEFKSCSNTKDIAQNLRDKGTDIEIIKKGPDIEQLISAAIVKTDPKPTIRLNNKLFSPAKIIASKLIPLIGILQDSTDAEEISRKEREERERKEREKREKKERSRWVPKDLRIQQQELLPIGEKITVYVTYIYNCGYFCVQKEDSCIDQITEELQKDCKTKSAPNLELLKIGQFCAGLFSADKCWARAKINDIKDSEPKIELLYVDYGDVERVLSKDIRWLSEKTAAAPAQCIKCSLYGIQPLETEIRWSSSSAEAFAKIIKDVPLIAVTRTHYDKTCDVDLCLVSDPVISINDKLVQQRVVRSIFPVESYLEENEEAGEEEVEEEEVEEEEVDASCPV